MNILYFDCFSGISGDMTLGALLDLGVDVELLKNELSKLKLDGYHIEVNKKTKSGIAGTDLHVALHDEHSHGSNDNHEHHLHSHHDHGDQGAHVHVHEHLHKQEHHHGHSHKDEGHNHTARNLIDIENMIEDSGLSTKVKDFSKKVFREIARAEAKVHNKEIHEVHFHEVGAVDSIVDIVGVSICLDLLKIDCVYASPLHDGQGFIECRHGKMPVPVPAVMEMLSESNIPLVIEDVNTELVTPTGIGIVKCLTKEFGKMPQMRIQKTGYGFGKRETGRFNALRVVMGTISEQSEESDEITILETNIDNIGAEILGYTMETLFENGALDVFYTPIFMKKNRPAVMLTVLARKEDEEKMSDIIFRETTTLGIRTSTCKRHCMHREFIKVDTGMGEVAVKVASRGEVRKMHPEYEDCRKIAKKTGLPLNKVYDKVNEYIQREGK